MKTVVTINIYISVIQRFKWVRILQLTVDTVGVDGSNQYCFWSKTCYGEVGKNDYYLLPPWEGMCASTWETKLDSSSKSRTNIICSMIFWGIFGQENKVVHQLNNDDSRGLRCSLFFSNIILSFGCFLMIPDNFHNYIVFFDKRSSCYYYYYLCNKFILVNYIWTIDYV